MAKSRRQAGKRPGFEESAEAREPTAASPWEWVAAALGALVVGGFLGYLVWYGATAESGPPLLTVEAAGIEAYDGKWIVRFRVSNAGDSTAAALTVEGSLLNGDREVERSDVTIDYVPSRSVRHGGLVFTRDPARHRLELRPKGYHQP